jgi:hypothetical protein
MCHTKFKLFLKMNTRINPGYAAYFRANDKGWLYSMDDANSGDPSKAFVYDVFYASREGKLYDVIDFVSENPRLVNGRDRYGSI